MKAKSIRGTSAEEIKKELEHSMSDGFAPTLAIVFLSVSQDRNAISGVLSEQSIQIFGVTTNGEFTDEEPQHLSTAILLLEMNQAYFSILFKEYRNDDFREVAFSLAKETLHKFQQPAFLIAGSHLSTDAEALLHGFEDAINPLVNVYGCMDGDDVSFTDQFVFTNQWESNKGMLVLALDEEKIMIKGKATCGWKAVGTEKTVTKSEGTHVFTVDNVPVLDLTAKYGGIENVTPENPNLLLEVAANLPLQLQREKGDPVMRPGLIVDWSDHSFHCSGSVPQGSKVRFSLPPDFDVMEKVIQATEDMKANEMPEADAVVVFSCAGRILSLGPLMTQELEGIKNVWKVPMVGMFSNAELARVTGGNLEMNNLTTCVVALKEK
jgi:hypothetical protein